MIWHPNATRRPIAGRDGLTYTGPGRKIVLHTTETLGLPNYSWPPHLTFNPATGQLWQHVPFNRGAYALASTISTCGWSVNWRGQMVVQVEIIAYARDVPGKSDEWYEALRGLLTWLTSNLDVPWEFPFPFDGSRAYGTNGSVRQSCAAWAAVSGIVGHQHCPAPNTHWDPGRLDITRLSPTIPPIGDDDMDLEAIFKQWTTADLKAFHRAGWWTGNIAAAEPNGYFGRMLSGVDPFNDDARRLTRDVLAGAASRAAQPAGIEFETVQVLRRVK